MESDTRSNILFIMCDQFRYDAISALHNSPVKTPNIDRLAHKGVVCSEAYSTCPVCIPARYVIRTGCEPPLLGCFYNTAPKAVGDNAVETEQRCGEYIARVLSKRGYRTFGIGKFHTHPDPYEDVGYETHIHTEELWDTAENRNKDGYINFINTTYPEYAFLEQPHGERTNMYYIPQMRAVPQKATVEEFVTQRAIEEISRDDIRPFFGMVSFIGPHPPCAPPIPYNRMIDPDTMNIPYNTDISIDHMDAYLPWMNHLIWADELNDTMIKMIKSRYYAEITYLDSCIGRILDAVESLTYAENTLICFYSDHGDLLGDHHAWQKESFFEASNHIPFIIRWPKVLSSCNRVYHGLISLADLFCLATRASGEIEMRDGVDVVHHILNDTPSRDYLFGYHGEPGTRAFKMMVRTPKWKYVYFSHGAKEQLFSFHGTSNDRYESINLSHVYPDVCATLKQRGEQEVASQGLCSVLNTHGVFKQFPYQEYTKQRIKQFDSSMGISDFLLT